MCDEKTHEKILIIFLEWEYLDEKECKSTEKEKEIYKFFYFFLLKLDSPNCYVQGTLHNLSKRFPSVIVWVAVFSNTNQ